MPGFVKLNTQQQLIEFKSAEDTSLQNGRYYFVLTVRKVKNASMKTSYVCTVDVLGVTTDVTFSLMTARASKTSADIVMQWTPATEIDTAFTQ